MKKWICFLLAGVLLLSLTACRKEDKTPATQPQTNPTQPPTRPKGTQAAADPADTKTQPADHIYFLGDAPDQPAAKILTVTDLITQKEIQTIRLSGNEWFTPEPIYTDITFDGHQDILVPAQRAASGAFFAGYIWNEQTEQYVYAPSLENIPNIAPDTENRLILSCRTAGQITNYGMYRYNGDTRDFEIVYSLHWKPDAWQVLVTESLFADGKETQLKCFFVPAVGVFMPEKSDPNMAPYYEAGSLWDLDSDKWRSWVYTP